MRGCFALAAIGLLVSITRADDGLPTKTLDAVKDATVLISTQIKNDDATHTASGSGFLIRVEGRTGYLVTNNHVIRGAHVGGSRPRVTFRAGSRSEQTVSAEIVATAPEPDLAVLRVADVANLPRPLDVFLPPDLAETRPVYVFGFPFGRELAPGRGKLAVVVSRGSISSIRRHEDGHATAVLIDGALNPGNSGGPVVDSQGRLVGIAAAVIRDAHIGIAVAPPELHALLEGHPEGVNLALKSTTKDHVELKITVPVFDPLDQIGSVSLLYAPDRKADAPEEDGDPDETAIKPLENAKTIKLARAGQQFQGALALPGSRMAAGLDLSYQLTFVDRNGQQRYQRPSHYLLSRVRKNGNGVTLWGDLVDPDGDCTVQLEESGVRFELPGKLHDLNGAIGKTNAPRLVQDVEGDFVAQVKISGELQPSAPSTRTSALPYNGAGFAVWLDADHFVRAERGAVLRNKKIQGLFLFENFEQARVIARHNGFLEQGDVYLKIERHGAKLLALYSTDGKAWTETEPMEIPWPPRLKLGLCAISSSFSPMSVRFDEFSVRPLRSKNSRESR